MIRRGKKAQDTLKNCRKKGSPLAGQHLGCVLVIMERVQRYTIKISGLKRSC